MGYYHTIRMVCASNFRLNSSKIKLVLFLSIRQNVSEKRNASDNDDYCTNFFHRNNSRKHEWLEVWENVTGCGNTSRQASFSKAFSSSPMCFCNLIETQRTCIVFLLENTESKKTENNFDHRLIKMKFSLSNKEK